jgi:hypothetical protein
VSESNPELYPGRDLTAAIGRIKLWLELHPEVLNVAGEIGGSKAFLSPGWPYPMYAMDRRDLIAVLEAAEIQANREDGT